MKFNIEQRGRESPRDESLIRLPKPRAILASGISTSFVPSDPNEFCDRLILLLLEKQAGIYSNRINDEIVATIDKLLEHKCISKKQHKQILFKCNLLHTRKM